MSGMTRDTHRFVALLMDAFGAIEGIVIDRWAYLSIGPKTVNSPCYKWLDI